MFTACCAQVPGKFINTGLKPNVWINISNISCIAHHFNTAADITADVGFSYDNVHFTD